MRRKSFSVKKRRWPEKKDSGKDVDEIVRELKESAVPKSDYRERSLNIHGLICAKCAREFDYKDRHLLTVHHKDGNPQNNDPLNLMRLCRSCHLKQHRGRKSCSICGKPVKGLGFCEKHYQRFKKYGDPLMFKRNQNTPVIRLED